MKVWNVRKVIERILIDVNKFVGVEQYLAQIDEDLATCRDSIRSPAIVFVQFDELTRDKLHGHLQLLWRWSS